MKQRVRQKLTWLVLGVSLIANLFLGVKWFEQKQVSENIAVKAGCVIKGNFHKGTRDRVYHLPECYNYKRININPNEGDRWFCSEEEAIKAGFDKSKDCPGEK